MSDQMRRQMLPTFRDVEAQSVIDSHLYKTNETR
jgi:hypothetical protein